VLVKFEQENLLIRV